MKKEKLIDIIFWCWIIFGWLIDFNTALSEEGTVLRDLAVITQENPNFKWTLIGMLLLLFVMQFAKNGIVVIGYVAYKLVKRKHRTERLDKIDSKNENYYREIIPKYSVAVLSYVDDFSIDTNDIAATILSLKLKKCIEVYDDRIEILNENIELSSNEEYILECIKNKCPVSMHEFEKRIKNDSFNSNLLEVEFKVGKKFLGALGGSALSGIMGVFFTALLVINSDLIDAISSDFEIAMFALYMLLILACFAGFPTLFWIKFFLYIGIKTKDPYMRSKKGKEINEKLEGLRKYILDYSSMEEKDKNALVVWEEYLIYSVVFGINKKAADDVLKLIQ